MKITLDKMNEYIDQYVTGVIIPSAKNPITKFALGFARGANVLRMAPHHVDRMRAIGLADEAGNIEVDALKKAVYSGMEMAGSLPLKELGITLDRPDFDRFFRLVETGAVG